MKRKLLIIAILTLVLFVSFHVRDFIQYINNDQETFELQPILLISAILAAILWYAFDNAKDERGKPREWDREDWVDPLADDDEDKK